MTAKEILGKMRRYIARYGWKANDLGDAKGPCCVRGAMNAVVRKHPRKWVDDLTLERVEKRIAKVCPHANLYGVVAWNNKEGTTKNEVLDVLKKAQSIK